MVDLTRFIDRNPALLGEVKELAEKPSKTYIGGSTHITGHPATRFGTIDSIFSPSLQREIHVGSKTVDGLPDDLKSYFLRSLSHLTLLEEYCPELSPLMPLFMGAVVDQNGVYKRILMEDYSSGNQLRIHEMQEDEQDRIPTCIKQFMEPPDSWYKYFDLAKAFVFVGGELRILDLDSLPWLLEHAQKIYQMRAEFATQPEIFEKHLIRLPSS